MLIRCRYVFNLTDIGFAYSSLKHLLVSSNGKKLYKETSSLQPEKTKISITKNQLIFLQGCIHHCITLKSFQLKSLIKTKKAFKSWRNIVGDL